MRPRVLVIIFLILSAGLISANPIDLSDIYDKSIADTMYMDKIVDASYKSSKKSNYLEELSDLAMIEEPDSTYYDVDPNSKIKINENLEVYYDQTIQLPLYLWDDYGIGGVEVDLQDYVSNVYNPRDITISKLPEYTTKVTSDSIYVHINLALDNKSISNEEDYSYTYVLYPNNINGQDIIEYKQEFTVNDSVYVARNDFIIIDEATIPHPYIIEAKNGYGDVIEQKYALPKVDIPIIKISK